MQGIQVHDSEELAQVTLAGMLITIGNIGLDIEAIEEIDLNPVIISGTKPFVVDALIVLSSKQ